MSLEHDNVTETAIERRNPLALLGSFPLLRDLDTGTLAAVAAEVEWFSLPGGARLFGAGEEPDAMYLVISGGLGAYIDTPAGSRLVGRIAVGETVGEMALISGNPRVATVVALRDSEVGRFSRQAFESVLLTHPQAMLRLTQLMVQRLERSLSQQRVAQPVPRTFALFPHDLEVNIAEFAAQMLEALKQHGRTELVWSARGADHTSHWFHNIETANDFVIYVADHGATPWSKLCMRQADAALLVARAEGDPSTWPLPVERLRNAELMLVHDEKITPGRARAWLDEVPVSRHHHIRGMADIRRVTRLLTGRGIGLVLSGGGARGFAHIGVMRALREANIPIDAVGGSSLGGILGAAVAGQWTHEEMLERFHRTFVATNPLNDYTLPLVSLVSGRKVTRLLRGEFGEIDIEDLPLPFFCVSSNLTTGSISVHRRGLLWRWLRASVAIPGVLPPIFHKGEVHVDGGAMNNLPIDVMRTFGRGPVIGVDVGADRAFTADFDDVDVPGLWKAMSWFRAKKKRVNIFQILWRAGMVNSAAVTLTQRGETDLLLQPPLESVDMLNWKAFDKAIDAGYRHTLERLESLPAAGLGAQRL